MTCWHCRNSAVASCRFCGRGACPDHVKERPYIVALYRPEGADAEHAVVVEDAVWCGACHPRPDPIPLPELG